MNYVKVITAIVMREDESGEGRFKRAVWYLKRARVSRHGSWSAGVCTLGSTAAQDDAPNRLNASKRGVIYVDYPQ